MGGAYCARSVGQNVRVPVVSSASQNFHTGMNSLRSQLIMHVMMRPQSGETAMSFDLQPLEARRMLAATVYVQTNLVSDGAVAAAHTDADLKNPWGISAQPSGPWWVSDNGTHKTTLY